MTSLDAQETWALVTATQAGNSGASAELYKRYAPRVRSFLLRRLGSPTLADDFTSETFLRALRNIGSVTYEGSGIGAWLQTIADNLAKDHFKSSRHQRELLTGEIYERPNPGDGLERQVVDAAERKWMLTQLAHAVGHLESAAQRQCLSLLLRGASIADVADAMGRTPGAVGALRHRALPKLRELITQPVVSIPPSRRIRLRGHHPPRCSGPRCTRPPECAGYCTPHYQKFYKAGLICVGLIDPTAVRARLAEHVARGGALGSFATVCEVPVSSLYEVASGRTRRVHKTLADAILAAPLRPSNNECTRLVRSWLATGHSMPRIAVACGVPAQTLWSSMYRGRFTDRIAHRLPAAAKSLSNQNLAKARAAA